MTFIALSPKTPDTMWVTIGTLKTPGVDDPEINVMLWANEESAAQHFQECVRFHEAERHGPHYGDCAVMDAMADWRANVGADYAPEDGHYAISCKKLDVFLSFPTGIRSVSLYRADLKAGRVNDIPTSPRV